MFSYLIPVFFFSDPALQKLSILPVLEQVSESVYIQSVRPWIIWKRKNGSCGISSLVQFNFYYVYVCIYVLVCICMWMSVHIPWYKCGGQTTTCRPRAQIRLSLWLVPLLMEPTCWPHCLVYLTINSSKNIIL